MVTSNWGIVAKDILKITTNAQGPVSIQRVSAGIEIPYSDKIFYTKKVCRSYPNICPIFMGFLQFLSFNGTPWNNRCN